MSSMETLVREHRLAQERIAREEQAAAETAEWNAMVRDAYLEDARRALHATEAAGFTR
jgi:hypothetical protein